MFVSGEPISFGKLAKINDVSAEEVELATDKLSEILNQEGRGVRVIKKDAMVQMVTNPEFAPMIDQLVKSEFQDALSKPALEVLSIIAYRGPVSRNDIEAIRGVNCSFTLRNLLMRGLIERIDNPNDSRGYLYRVSLELLKTMGIQSISDLPKFDILSKDERLKTIIPQEQNENENA